MPAAWHSPAAALVLAGSLAGKVAVQDVAITEDRLGAAQALAASIAGQGYAVAFARPGLPVVRAERGNCRLVARVLDPHGTFRDTEQRRAPPGWRFAYAWRGSIDTSLPRLGPLGEYYLARELARVGFVAHRAPVVMLAIQPGCPPIDPAVLDIRETLMRVSAR